MASSRDTVTIGLTARSRDVLNQLEALDWWPSNEAIAKFCMAGAIKAGQGVGKAEGTTTVWAAGNFDPDGEIRGLVSALYDTDTPVRQIEYLVNEGLLLMEPRLKKQGLMLTDLFDD